MLQHWQEKEIEFLKENYPTVRDKELSKTLHRTLKAISFMAFKLRLKKDKDFYCQSRKKLPFDITKEQLIQLYCVEKKSIKKIARELKVGKNTPDYYLNKFKITKRTKSEACKERFKKESVWSKGLSITDPRIKSIAEKTSERFKKRRDNKIRDLKLKYKMSLSELLNHLYWNRKFTQEKIAKTIKFGRSFVINSMREYKIKLRPNYEYIRSLRGIKHPLYGVTWEQTYGKEGAEERRRFFRKFAREMVIKRIVNKEFPFYNTKPELLLAEEMKKRNISFVEQFNVNNKFVYDFAIPRLKIAIECDGDYWHANPKFYDRTNLQTLHPAQIKKIQRDEVKEDYLTKKGWKVLRFFEYDIKQDVKQCVDKIEEVSKEQIKN